MYEELKIKRVGWKETVYMYLQKIEEAYSYIMWESFLSKSIIQFLYTLQKIHVHTYIHKLNVILILYYIIFYF